MDDFILENGEVQNEGSGLDLNSLTDKQNLLLTQLSYESHVLAVYSGMSLSDIRETLLVEDTIDTIATLDSIDRLCEAGLGTLVITAVGNDSVTGFGAIAFTDGCGNTGITYRGTDGVSFESLNDWIDNLIATPFGTSTQNIQAHDFFEAHKSADGNSFLYGHSKGGQLSESVFADNYDLIKKIHLLNPQPTIPMHLRTSRWRP